MMPSTTENRVRRDDGAQRHSILVAYDLSVTGGIAFDEALKMAHATGAQVHVIYVAHSRGDKVRFGEDDAAETVPLDEAGKKLERVVQTRIDEFAAQVPKTGFHHMFSHLRVGNAADEIIQLAKELEATLILVGTHGRSGVQRLVLGSVAETVVRQAPCPVLVVRPRATHKSETPEVEPACPHCLVARKESGGRQLWCEQHAQGQMRRHTYHQVPRNVRAQENMPLTFPMGR